jgi:hypothetical protein
MRLKLAYGTYRGGEAKGNISLLCCHVLLCSHQSKKNTLDKRQMTCRNGDSIF